MELVAARKIESGRICQKLSGIYRPHHACEMAGLHTNRVFGAVDRPWRELIMVGLITP